VNKRALSRRWLFVSIAAVVMAAGGRVAVLTASAAETTPALPNTIEAVHSGKCLSTAGAAGPVTQQACAAGATARQAFRLAAVAGGYTISPLTGAGCLGVSTDTPIRLVARCTGGAEQKFVATRSGNGYALKNVQNGRCVDVASRSAANGAAVIHYQCNGQTNQQWRLQDAGNGYVQLIARHSGKCLDVTGAATTDGAQAIQWTCGAGTNQQWQRTQL